MIYLKCECECSAAKMEFRKFVGKSSQVLQISLVEHLCTTIYDISLDYRFRHLATKFGYTTNH